MSNRDQRDTSKEPVTDETATRDIGGAFGGSAGPMESKEEHEEFEDQSGLTKVQNRANALSRPPTNVRGGPSEPLTYSPDAGTGMQGAPMSQTDARDTTTATTDTRRVARDEDQDMGRDHAVDPTLERTAGRDNLPERGSAEESDAF